MPSNMLYLDTNFPSFTGEESPNEKIDTIQNYLYMVMEQLRYSLRNLDRGNFNAAGLGEITDPIYAKIEDTEGRITQLQVTAEGLALRVGDAENNITQLQVTAEGIQAQVSDAELNITQLQIKAEGIQAQVSDAEQNIFMLQLTSQGLQTQVSNAEGSISRLEQKVNNITLSVSNGEYSSSLDLYANGMWLSSANIFFTGMVTFTDLSGDGTTTINGSNIKTGTISCERILLGGKMSVYQSPYLGAAYGGYLGYMTGMTASGTNTGGMGIADATQRAVMICTNAGARIGYDGASTVVCTNGSVTITGNYIYLNGSVYVNGKLLT